MAKKIEEKETKYIVLANFTERGKKPWLRGRRNISST